MAELSYLFKDCDGNEHHCNVFGIDVSFLHKYYVYKSQEFGCVEFYKISEEPPTETITIIDGVYVDCDACSAGKHLQAHHFRKGCSAQEYEDIFVIDIGKIKPKEYAYYQDLYNGCWQYIGYDDVGINGQLLDYMEFNKTPYDNCHCAQMFDAYLFKDCDGNDYHFKQIGKFDIGTHYKKESGGSNCFEYIGKTQVGYEPQDIFISDGECNCDKHSELTIKPKHGDIEYYERVNCEFADAVFNEAMAERYGVEFCCEKDLTRLVIKKKLLDAGALQDDVDLCKCEN